MSIEPSRGESPLPSSTPAEPLEHSLRSRYQPGATPLEFIQKNLKQTNGHAEVQPSPNPVPLTEADIPPAVTAVERILESFEPLSSQQEPNDLSQVDKSDATDTAEDSDESDGVDVQDDDDSVEEDKGPKVSLRKLRKANNEIKGQLQTVQTELQQATEKLQRVEAGEEAPERVRELEERIATLEHFEKLHAFRLSPEYKRKYAAPLENLKQQARQLAEEYEVPVAVLDQALKLDSKKEMNAYLRRYFDDVAALEARETLTGIKSLLTDAQQAEREPQETLSRLQQETVALERQAENTRITNVIKVSQAGWQEALNDLTAQETFPELIIRPDSPEHNKVAQPIIEAAAKEFGAFMKLLGVAGVKELPPQAMKMLAKRFQLSQAAAVIAESRSQYAARADQIATSAVRTAPYVRPQVGSSAATPPPMNEAPRGIKALPNVLNGILQQRGK